MGVVVSGCALALHRSRESCAEADPCFLGIDVTVVGFEPVCGLADHVDAHEDLALLGAEHCLKVAEERQRLLADDLVRLALARLRLEVLLDAVEVRNALQPLALRGVPPGGACGV